MALRYTAGGGLTTQRLEEILRGHNVPNGYNLAVSKIVEATKGSPALTANMAMDELGPEGNDTWGKQSDQFINPEVKYKFQAWPGCCPICQAKDGMEVSSAVPPESITHPNCKCRVVPATEYSAYGSTPTR